MPCGSICWETWYKHRDRGSFRAVLATLLVQPWKFLKSGMLLGTVKQHRFARMLCSMVEGKQGAGGAL